MAADGQRFKSSAEHSLDEKGRLVVPSRFREALGADFVLTIALPDACLALYPSAKWAQLCDNLEAEPKKDARYRSFVRFLFAHSEEVVCDSQGRIVIPAALRAYAGIDKDVISVGTLKRVEIWARERYAAQVPDPETLGSAASDYGFW